MRIGASVVLAVISSVEASCVAVDINNDGGFDCHNHDTQAAVDTLLGAGVCMCVAPVVTYAAIANCATQVTDQCNTCDGGYALAANACDPVVHKVEQRAGLDRKHIVALMRSSQTKEDLAASLVESSQADVVNADVKCANMTGPEHCQECAMPAIKTLLHELHQVKLEVWADLTRLKAVAGNTCTERTPEDRFGSYHKCCSGIADNLFSDIHRLPKGYAQCTGTFGQTFSPPGNPISSTALDYTAASGWVYIGASHPSDMIADCCEPSSKCTTNWNVVTTQMTEVLRVLDGHSQELAILMGHLEGNQLESIVEHAKKLDADDQLKKYCFMSPALEAAVPKCYPKTIADAKVQCVGGALDNQVAVFLATQKARKDEAVENIEKQEAVSAVIDKVTGELNMMGGSCDTYVTPNFNISARRLREKVSLAPVVAMIAKAEKTMTAPSQHAVLAKTMSLVESNADADESTLCSENATAIQNVMALLVTVQAEVKVGIGKLKEYSQEISDQEDLQMAQLVSKITNQKLVSDTAFERIGVLAAQAAQLQECIGHVNQLVQTQKVSWALLHDSRESNAKACIDFMVYFDSENIVNIEELLILNSIILEIEAISCRYTEYPTAFPTAFPTQAPTVTSQPTAFPTRAPTAIPTGAPTAEPTDQRGCAAGNWKFMSKVFASPERFAVPAYADGVQYSIASTTAGQCRTIETSHTNIEGAVQAIKHQYKCCGNTGNFYGAIASDNATAADLCDAAGNGDHCGLFGANMYTGATDPSNGTITTGQTTAPTDAPTSFPTRAPSATPSGFPTRAPTTFPTTRAPTPIQHEKTRTLYPTPAGATYAPTAAPSDYPTVYYPTPGAPTPPPAPAPLLNHHGELLLPASP